MTAANKNDIPKYQLKSESAIRKNMNLGKSGVLDSQKIGIHAQVGLMKFFLYAYICVNLFIEV